jgi:hypothetical protein
MTGSFARVVWLVILISAPVLAQSDAGNLTVISFPPGTAIKLEGEYTLAGVTPVTFNQKLHGIYSLTAERAGYEKYEMRLALTSGDPYQIDFELSPKTRFKAAMRSLVVPGWGQVYNKRKFRGVLYASAAVISLVSLFATDQDFRDKRDEYERALDLYRDARNIEEKRILSERLDSAQDEAYDAETVRQVAFGVAACVWAFNVVDAAVFFADRCYSVGGPTSISLDTGSNFNRVGFKLAVSF